MCGGIGFKVDNVTDDELSQFYSDQDILKFRQSGIVYSFFWKDNNPIPYIDDNNISLSLWGNKNKALNLPRTGWAKIESIEDKKWDYLKPKKVIIPATKGYEKGVWFDIDFGMTGILITDNRKENHIYMLTKPASEKYLKLTKHSREPIFGTK